MTSRAGRSFHSIRLYVKDLKLSVKYTFSFRWNKIYCFCYFGKNINSWNIHKVIKLKILKTNFLTKIVLRCGVRTQAGVCKYQHGFQLLPLHGSSTNVCSSCPEYSARITEREKEKNTKPSELEEGKKKTCYSFWTGIREHEGGVGWATSHWTRL